MAAHRTITLTTDFGLRDTFVGQMKGRILSVCPDTSVVDLTHDVPPQDVDTGSFMLMTGYSAFPDGTIHVAVVDPGVGSGRRPLIVCTQRFRFVAPDNGLLTRVLEEEPSHEAFVIEATHYLADSVSHTFHGRDVFAPAAAWLARGVDPQNFGPPAGDLVKLSRHAEAPSAGRPVRARIVQIDRFGNATVDLPRSLLEPLLGPGGSGLRVVADRGEAATFCRTYDEAAGRGAFLLFNSSGHLEVAVYRGSAAEELGLELGREVEVRIGD